MTIDDIVEIGQYLQSLGYGQNQAVVTIQYGAASKLATDTYMGLVDWYENRETVWIQAAPLLFPDKGGVSNSYPLASMSDLGEAEIAEVRIARETAPTVGLVTSPV